MIQKLYALLIIPFSIFTGVLAMEPAQSNIASVGCSSLVYKLVLAEISVYRAIRHKGDFLAFYSDYRPILAEYLKVVGYTPYEDYQKTAAKIFLFNAVACGNVQAADYFLSRSPGANSCRANGTVLTHAVTQPASHSEQQRNQIEMVTMLMDRGAFATQDTVDQLVAVHGHPGYPQGHRKYAPHACALWSTIKNRGKPSRRSTGEIEQTISGEIG